MQLNLTALMAAVIVIALGSSMVARGRWSGPWWLVVIGTLVAYPFSHTLMDRVEDAPGGWVRWLFQVSCGLLVAVLAAPVYHRLRGSAVKDADGRTGEHTDIRPVDAPRPAP
ncbi:hypothetical protein ABTZ58_24045 [Streptomyces sp. NPDC094143]|uniref:hypothetical protein n=1 Tax=Streptomyces sp. NPDC094143 TaxID=3155310 RepID=UPI00331A05F9